jgi:exoribonuclease R
MQYYDEHIINQNITDNNIDNTILSNLETRILKVDDDIFYFDDDFCSLETNNCKDCKNIVINNRGISGDLVYLYKIENDEGISSNKFKVVGIKERFLKNEKIVGILYLDSKIKYNNSAGKQLFLFKPTNKKYPNFYVTYNIKSLIKNKLSNIYCIVEFKEWTIYQKLPHGIVTEKIGLLGDKESEYEHLRIYHDLRNQTLKIDSNLKLEHNKLLEKLINSKVDYEVFSIDPVDSKDIDDSFHIKKIECDEIELERNEIELERNEIELERNEIELERDGIDDLQYEIGIHIACPYYFFKDMIDKIMDIGTTIYMPHRIYNMLPNIYSENYVSLIQGEKRYALSLILKINEKYELLGYIIKPTIVKNIRMDNYDNFEKTYNSNEFLKLFVKVTSKFFNNEECIWNSHKLVELWMIFANKTIANHLLKNNDTFKNIILRVHHTSEINKINYENINQDENLDKDENINLNKGEIINLNQGENENKLKEYLQLRIEKSAKYVLYNDDNKNEDKDCDELNIYKHSKLGNDYYTHFTSPIRRAIDLFIHGLLINKKDLYDTEELNRKILHINNITKKSRKLDRNIRRLDFLYRLKEKSNFIETIGYIIEFNKNKMSCNVYIPEYNLEERVYLVPHKFKSIVNFVIDENNSKCTIEYNDFKREFYINKIVNLKLWIFLLEENIFEKMRVEILE